MWTRRHSREWALQVLFALDLNPSDPTVALDDFWREHDPVEEGARRFTELLVQGTWANRAEIDAAIVRYAQNWDIGRMAITDRNAMRLGIYEMLHRTDIPPVVSINEAVDLAKYFNCTESGRFVNGILDRIRKDIDRPARQAAPKKRESPS